MEDDVQLRFSSACDLYLDGRLAEASIRRRTVNEAIVFENGAVSESSSAPFKFSPLVVTGEKNALSLSAYLELIMDVIRRRYLFGHSFSIIRRD